jgi:hypothetical protein
VYRVMIYSWLDLDEVLRYSTRQHYPLGRKRWPACRRSVRGRIGESGFRAPGPGLQKHAP